MSSLIDQLKAQSGDPRSTRELTLILGEIAEREGRKDLLLSNPDFESEYLSIKDEIDRLNRPSIGAEIGRGFGSGIDEMQATGYGLGALAAEGAQKIGIPGAGAARDYFLQGVQEQQAQAAENPVTIPSYQNISKQTPIEDTLRYAAGGLGQLLPSMGVAAASGLAGAAVGTAVEPGGGTIGGALLGLAERNLAKKVVDRALAQGLAITTEQVIAQLPKDAILAEAKNLVAQSLSQGALAASSIGQEVGSIYAQDPNGPNAAVSAIGFGIPAGLLDVLPESYVLSRFFPGKGEAVAGAVGALAKKAAKVEAGEAAKALSYWRRFATEAAKTVPMEASTEAAQTALEIAASKFSRGQPVTFTEDDYSQMLNAGVLGGIGGLGLAPVSAFADGREAAVSEPGPASEPALSTPESFTPPPAPTSAAPQATSALPPEVQEAMQAVAAATGQLDALQGVPVALPATEPAMGAMDNPLSMQDAFSTQPPAPTMTAPVAPAPQPVSDLRQAATNAIASSNPLPLKQPDPTWLVTVQAADGDIPGFIQVDKIGPDGDSQGSYSPEDLRLEGYQLPDLSNVAQGQYKVGELMAAQATTDPVTKAPVPTVEDVMPVQTKPEPITVSVDDDAAIEAAIAGQSPIFSPAPVETATPPTPDILSGKAPPSGAGETQLTMRVNPQVQTPEFANWFRESKVVDAQGKPMVVYHGTTRDITSFSGEKSGSKTGNVTTEFGSFFSDSPQEASRYAKDWGEEGGNVLPVYLSIKKPYQMPYREFDALAMGAWNRMIADPSYDPKKTIKFGDTQGQQSAAEKLRKYETLARADVQAKKQDLIDAGYDGIVVRVGGNTEYIAFTPTQIKSATGNRGSFDRTNPDITLTQRTSADFQPAPSSAVHLLDSAVKAFTQDRGIPVAPFQKALLDAGQSAIDASGLVTDAKTGQVYVGYTLDAINGNINPQSIIALLHEAAHDLTNGLPENLRTAFQEAVDQLPWTAQRWLNNPLALESTLLANSDPATLSDLQRKALAKLTPEEIANLKLTNPETIVGEKMAEHLAQLGWSKADAVSMIDRLFRFIKDLWLRVAMAIQQQIKGPEHTNPDLARQFVENRFLQFINRDAAYARDRLNDLKTWLGIPETTRQRQPDFPGGADADMRMQYADPETGLLIPISYGTYTPDALQAYLKRSIDNAARYVREAKRPGQPEADVQLTKRVNFGPPLAFEPSAAHNISIASANLEQELYLQIKGRRNIAALLPRVNGQLIDDAEFMQEWLRLPAQQMPDARKGQIVQSAQQAKDPLTGQPVTVTPAITVSQLPSYTETIKGKEKEDVQVRLSEQQDEALRQTIWAMRDTQRRMQAKLKRDTDRLNDLVGQSQTQGTQFPAAARRELDELQRDTLVRVELTKAVIEEIRRLESKFDPRTQVVIAPTLPYLRVPSPTATEEEILANKRGIVPRDLNFSGNNAKQQLGADLAALQEWLAVPENKEKGAIYGTISETYRKLNQIPTDLKRVHTNVLFRRTMTTGLPEELRLTGIPSLVALQKKFTEVTRIFGENRTDFHNLGVKWETAFVNFAKAMGMQPDQTFRDTVWTPLMRIKNSIDVSRRAELKSANWSGVIDTAAKAMSAVAGLEVNTPARRETLRDLLLSVIDNERAEQSVAAQNNLKVKDDQLGLERRFIQRGLVTGRVTLSRHLRGLFARMNPMWSDTAPIGPQDPRNFWRAAADLYRADRPAFDKKVAELFPSYVTTDFVDPWANWVEPIFDAPLTPNNSVPRKAALVNVRQAWRDAKGNVTAFAERLHTLEGGVVGDEQQTVGNVLKALLQKFEKTKHLVDEQLAHEGMGRETLPRQLMDAREGFDLPPEHVSYATYTPTDNLTVLQQMAMNAAFGRDALGADSELHMTLMEARRDLAALWARHEEMVARGLKPKQIEQRMGRDDAKIARNYWATSEAINNIEKAMRALSNNTGYLTGDFRAMNEALNFFATMMIQSPRSGAVNIIGDVVGSTAALGFSRPGIKAFWTSGQSVAKDMATALLRAFGANVKLNTDLAHELYVNGGREPEMDLTIRQKSVTLGSNLGLTKPTGSETLGAKIARGVTRLARTGREIVPDLGSPFQASVQPGDEAAAVAPKLRIGVFGTTALSTMLANNRAGHAVFGDLAMRGVKYINSLPTALRDKFVRNLELGTTDLDGRQLGYKRGVILNDENAFAYLKNTIETQMSGESSVGRFVAKAWRRQQNAGGGKWDVLSNSQFADIINVTNSYWTLQNNFATIPHWMASNPMFVFLRWPYLAMQRFGRTFADPQGRVTFTGLNSSVASGMKTFFLLAAPATIAGSFAVDAYDKYALGKRQNLRNASLSLVIPVYGALSDPKAFMERLGRYGASGFAGDILNRIVNYDTERNLSLDDRIVAVSSIETLLNALVVEPFQTGGNITYSSTVRPFLQGVGGGGLLQYLQVFQNLTGMNTEDAAVNARINTGNGLRAAGRELDLPVRVLRGALEAPTPVSPYLKQLELAALIDNPELFREAYKNALVAAREQGKTDPAKYIAENFADRHPLRRIFRTSPTEQEYRQLTGIMDPMTAGQVRKAVNSYNNYLTRFFNKPAFLGKKDEKVSIDKLLRESSALLDQGIDDFDLAFR